MNDVCLSDQLKVWGVSNEKIIYTDGSIGAVLQAKSIDVAYSSDDEVNGLTERLRSFLNALPDGLDIQFLREIVQSPNERIIHPKADSEAQQSARLVDELSEERESLYQAMNDSGALPHHDLSIILRKPYQGALIKRPRLFAKSRLFPEMADSEFEKQCADFEKTLTTIAQSIEALGVKVVRLTDAQVVEKIYRQWNPGREIPLGQYDGSDLRNGLVFTDAVVSPRGFALGDVDHRVLSLKLLPDQTYGCMARLLSELPFGSRCFLSIHVPQQAKEIEGLQTQRRLAYSLVNGRPDRVRDIDSEAKLNDLESIIEEMVQGGEKVFRVSLNVVLSGRNPDELDGQVSQCLAKIRELSGAEGLLETVAAFDVFSECCFPNARAPERQRRLKTSNLADFIPLYAPWSGHETKDATGLIGPGPSIFRSRSGSLLTFDPFASELTNANQLISGASGSGKSYLTNTLLLQFLKDNPKVYIIDIGGSYRKLVETLDGQYVPLGLGQDLGLNPFDLSAQETVPSEQKIKFLVGLIETMTKEDGSSRLPRLQRALLESSIQSVYEGSCNPTLSDLQKLLVGHEDPDMRSLGKILAQWTGDTPFGRFVDRRTNIELSSRLICFDLKGLDSHPDLQAACLFIITDLIWRSVQEDRSCKKYLIFDECWKILETSAGAALVGDVFRTFRKYYASAIAISQTIDDFARSPVAHAIIPNAAVKWVLKQRGANKDSLKETLSLNDTELAAVDSLNQERGSYSETFLLAGDKRSVVLVESTPLEYWIATTDPRDLAAVDEYKAKNPDSSTTATLKTLAKQYPTGVATAH